MHSGPLEKRFPSLPDAISSLGNHSGPLEKRFPSVPDPISSFGVHSGPLETRFASRAACAALVAVGPAALETCLSIDPPRDPMPVADDLWKQQPTRTLAHPDLRRASVPTNDSLRVHPNVDYTGKVLVDPFDRLVRSEALTGRWRSKAARSREVADASPP
jgi:hypothetical protein